VSAPAKLSIDSGGRVRGSGVSIGYNNPWPCGNGYSSGFKSPARGVVIHTEQGYENGTIAWFNNPAAQASAWFAVGLDGSIWQFAPVGSGWCSWAQADGNDDFYSIEDADNGHPSTPFSPPQVLSIALLTEVLSRHDGFPLAAATDPFTQRGVTLHSEGGQAFGGHLECPGTVRGAQRPQIIALAVAIRQGTAPPPAQNWTDAMIANLPTLVQGNADKAGSVQYVRRVQALVKVIGDVNKLPAASAAAVTGTYDRTTWLGVLAIQRMFGLTEDGAVGPATWGALVAGQHG
jgi:peptidoglycan hydrolase-like protein with peptidoglycan-binding domain